MTVTACPNDICMRAGCLQRSQFDIAIALRNDIADLKIDIAERQHREMNASVPARAQATQNPQVKMPTAPSTSKSSPEHAATPASTPVAATGSAAALSTAPAPAGPVGDVPEYNLISEEKDYYRPVFDALRRAGGWPKR